MAIRREDVDAGRIDFSDLLDRRGKPIGPIHPGEILREEFLAPLRLSVAALARALALPRTRINDIVLGRRAVSADTAMRLGRYFGTSPDLWLGLQKAYELDVAKRKFGARVAAEVRPRAA